MRYNVGMNKPLKIQKIGNSAGVILPKELLEELGAEVGGTLSVTRTPRGIELTASEASFDEQMSAMRKVMSQYKNALRELAK
jgi:putative addiction module antidote